MKMLNKTIMFLLMAGVLPAFAEGAEGGDTSSTGLKFIGAGIAISVAALGGALGQGKAVSSALDGIARNPAAQAKILTPMIIGLALMESLVIFSLVVALKILG